MRRMDSRTALALVCFALAPSWAAAADDPNSIGVRVVLLRGAVVHTQLSQVTGPAPKPSQPHEAQETEPAIYRVREIRAPGLWVAAETSGRRGWVHTADVVRVERAIEMESDRIRTYPEDSRALRRRAYFLRETDSLDKARADLNEAIRIDPKCAAAFAERGVVLYHQRRFDEALRDYNEALRIDPACVAALLGQSQVAGKNGENETACAAVEEAVRLEPENALAHRARAILLESFHKNVEGALTEFDRAVQIDGLARYTHDDPSVLAMRGMTRLKMDKPAEALADFSAAIAAEPDNAWGYFWRGYISAKNGKVDEALPDFNEAVRLAPKIASFRLLRGNAWLDRGEPDKAIRDLSDAIRLGCGREQVNLGVGGTNAQASPYSLRATAWFSKREYDKVFADLNDVIRLDPQFAEAYAMRANLWLEKKDFGKALADFSEAIRLDPKRPDVYMIRAMLWLQQSEPAKAIADLDELIHLDPTHRDAHLSRAVLLRFKGQFGEAIADLDEVIRLDPKYREAYVIRSGIWAQNGNYDKTIADLNEALRLDGNDARTYFLRGWAWNRKRDHAKALDDLNESIRLASQGIVASADRNGAAVKSPEIPEINSIFESPVESQVLVIVSLLERSSVWEAQDEPDKAITDATEVIRLAPTASDGYATRARARCKKQRVYAAIVDLNEALSLNHDNKHARLLRAQIKMHLEDYDAVIDDCKTLILFDAANDEVKALLARAKSLRTSKPRSGEPKTATRAKYFTEPSLPSVPKEAATSPRFLVFPGEQNPSKLGNSFPNLP